MSFDDIDCKLSSIYWYGFSVAHEEAFVAQPWTPFLSAGTFHLIALGNEYCFVLVAVRDCSRGAAAAADPSERLRFNLFQICRAVLCENRRRIVSYSA